MIALQKYNWRLGGDLPLPTPEHDIRNIHSIAILPHNEEFSDIECIAILPTPFEKLVLLQRLLQGVRKIHYVKLLCKAILKPEEFRVVTTVQRHYDQLALHFNYGAFAQLPE